MKRSRTPAGSPMTTPSPALRMRGAEGMAVRSSIVSSPWRAGTTVLPQGTADEVPDEPPRGSPAAAILRGGSGRSLVVAGASIAEPLRGGRDRPSTGPPRAARGDLISGGASPHPSGGSGAEVGLGPPRVS